MSSAFSITLTPGYQFSQGETLNYTKLNLLGNPAIQFSGALGTASLANQSVTTAILAAGAVTESNVANATFTPDSSGAAPFAAGWLSNLAVTQATMWPQGCTNRICTNNSTTPASQVDITADELVLKDNNGNLKLFTNVSLLGNNLLTNGANGLDTGSATVGWYYFYAVYNPTSQTLAGLISATGLTVANTTGGLTGPTLSGYTYMALVGAAYYNGSTWGYFRIKDRRVYLPAVQLASAAAMTSYGSYAAFTTNLATTVPPMAKAIYGNYLLTSDTLQIAGDPNGWGVGADSYLPATGASYNVPLFTSQTLYLKASSTSAHLNITVTGYEF